MLVWKEYAAVLCVQTHTFAKNFSNSCNKLDESLRQKFLQGTPNISVIRGISTLYRIDVPHHN